MFSKSIINNTFKRKNILSDYVFVKTFCDKPDLKFIKPKYYADLNKITPPEHYNENYKLKFG
jgi:hypothetical protein